MLKRTQRWTGVVVAMGCLVCPTPAVTHAGTLFQHSASITAGWSMGVAYDTDEAVPATGIQGQDLAPFLHLSTNLGDDSTWSFETKVVLTSFGRLFKAADVSSFTSDSAVAAVRRSVLTDFTIRTPAMLFASQKAGVCLNVNAGFSMDAERRPDDGDVLDAASYLFVGPTLFGVFAGGTATAADLLIGTSELLTGVEVFKTGVKHPVRLRPRFWVRFQDALGEDRALDFGLWGDLGTNRKHPDAITAFIATPLYVSK